MVKQIKNKILDGGQITKEEALQLVTADLKELCAAADEIRERFCSKRFDVCTIVNGKCGKCSEDCKFCAQSAHYSTSCTESYPLRSTEDILKLAKENDEHGVMRYSIVTSGKSLNDAEIDRMCETVKTIKRETGMSVCASFGLLNKAQLEKLKAAGVYRIHCNLETSRSFFPQICSTHTYDDKLKTIRTAIELGFSICSGGIIGLGETFEDRIDLAFAERELGVKSVPINILNPIKGTPFENNIPITYEDVLRTAVIFRFILPDAFLRLAGGRGLLSDKGKLCFESGVNAAISGNLLTTIGSSVDEDMKLFKSLGYAIQKPTD